MFFEEFLEWSVGQLQHFLTKRGKSVSGTKKELAARALVAFESNDPILDCPKDLTERLEREYQELIKKLQIQDPRQLDDGVWIDDLKTWPSLNLGHIFHYILSTKAFETSYIGQYKAHKAYSYFKSSHVHQVLTYLPPGSDDLVIVKSSVTPSMKVYDKPWSLWILISKSSGVISAYCLCTAGFSNCCNHVIATLYKIQFAVENGYTNPSCTEVPCAFNNRSNHQVFKKPMKVKDMDIVKHSIMKQESTQHCSLQYTQKTKYDPRMLSMQLQAPETTASFFSQLEVLQPKAVVLLTVPPSEDSDCPPPIPEIADTVRLECRGKNEADLLGHFMERLTFSEKQLDELEKATKEQASSVMWKKQRLGRITASNFHEVHAKVKAITASRGNIKPQTTPLLIKLSQPEPSLDHVDSVRWGKEKENKAREAFFKEEGPNHRSPKLNMCGLRALSNAPFLAATSDNIFTCLCCDRACVEIKCPFSIRGKSVEDGWEDVDFLHKVEGNIELKKTHKYFTQIQGQMKANSCSKAFFVVWTPVGKTLIQRIDFDECFWDEVYKNLILFFKLYLAKVLLGIHELNYCPVCEKRILKPTEIPVKQAMKENSTCCGECCQWYHWSCIGLTRHTPSVWICDFCNNNTADSL